MRGFELRHVSGGWRLYTREACAPFVERFVRDGQQARLTQAALETLAAHDGQDTTGRTTQDMAQRTSAAGPSGAMTDPSGSREGRA